MDVDAWALTLADGVRAAAGDALLGAYVHGSAALGGFVPGRSDVDLLFVVKQPLVEGERSRIVAAIQCHAGCPGSGVESSVLTADQARDIATGAFEVHVCTGADAKVVDGRGHPGDTDLVLHSVVVRSRGIALFGPPAAELFGTVGFEVVAARMRDELEWGLEHAGSPYAVLNACRAALWMAERRVVSKVAGGEWALARLPEHRAVIEAALDWQWGGPSDAGRPNDAAAAFVRTIMLRLGEAVG